MSGKTLKALFVLGKLCTH